MPDTTNVTFPRTGSCLLFSVLKGKHCRRFAFILIVSLTFLLLSSACSSEKDKLEASAYKDEAALSSDTMVMRTEKSQYSLRDGSSEVVLLLTCSESGKELGSSEYFQLEIQLDSKWYVIPHSAYGAIKDIAELIETPVTDYPLLGKIDLQKINYPLKSGSYRMIKSISAMPLAAYFEIV